MRLQGHRCTGHDTRARAATGTPSDHGSGHQVEAENWRTIEAQIVFPNLIPWWLLRRLPRRDIQQQHTVFGSGAAASECHRKCHNTCKIPRVLMTLLTEENPGKSIFCNQTTSLGTKSTGLKIGRSTVRSRPWPPLTNHSRRFPLPRSRAWCNQVGTGFQGQHGYSSD